MAISLSFVLHAVVLTGLCWQPAPVFVKPNLLARGEGGISSATAMALYLPRDLQVESAPQTAPLNLLAAQRMRPKVKKRHNILEAEKVNAAEAGSRLGSAMDGPAYGDEVKPALPVSFADPELSRSQLPSGLKGDVIIEVTIDVRGNVVEEKLLQGLGPGIDDKVMAAVREWHYRPATRNGIPVPSKHDVRYHFPS